MKNLVEIKDSRFGKGLFSKKFIPSGTVICPIPFNPEFDFPSTVQMKDRESHALQVDYDRYILCEPPFLYSNHCCNPNCGVNPFFQFIALKDIERGKELFWDYSTSMLERSWTMKCACGDKDCRNIVTDFDLLPREIQSKYLRLNIVFPFIAKYVQQQLAKSA